MRPENTIPVGLHKTIFLMSFLQPLTTVLFIWKSELKNAVNYLFGAACFSAHVELLALTETSAVWSAHALGFGLT